MVKAWIAFLILATCGVVQASPLLYFTLEGRTQGSMAPFASNLQVTPGDIVEYRLQMKMAPSGTYSSYLYDAGDAPGRHGVNSLSVSIIQDATDSIQVDLGTPAALAGDSQSPLGNGWNRGIGASGGDVTRRVGTDYRDLISIRPIHWAGIFTGPDETIFSGEFTVAELTGDLGIVRPIWGPWAGGGVFEGHIFYLTGAGYGPRHDKPPSEIGPDPIADFTPLRLTAAAGALVPEPSCLALVAASIVGLLAFVKRARWTK